MASGDVSPAPSAALSGRGLKGILAKARRTKPDNSSTASFATQDSNESHGIKDSMDSALEKIKNVARGDNNDPDGPGLAKLIPSRRKRKEKKLKALQQGEGLRGRSSGDGEGATGTGVSSESQSILDDEDDDGSDMMTDDSGEEPPANKTAPPLVTHPSHLGYLTSSSPIVKATTIPEEPSSRLIGNPVLADLNHATTLPPSPAISASNTNLAPDDLFSPGPTIGDSAFSAESIDSNRSKSRSISPGFRLKDAFKPGSRKNSTQNGSPDRASVSSYTGGNTLGGLFNKDRQGSISSRRSSKIPENIPIIPANIPALNAEAGTTNRHVPTIVTAPATPPRGSLETPVTTVTPPTPIDRENAGSPRRPSSVRSEAPNSSDSSNIVTSSSGNMISHRRVRSDSASHQPSKLSNAMSAPLTPMMEETKTAGSRTSSGNAAPTSGFFSSVFVAAQNAATTFQNTIGNNPSRPRSGTTESDGKLSQTSAVVESQSEDTPVMPPKPLAVDTIGSGDLSLSHLGISTDTLSQPTTAVSPTLAKEENGAQVVHRDEAAARAEDTAAARAVSVAYGEKLNGATSTTPIAEDILATVSKPPYESSMVGDRTPPNGSIYEGESGGIFRNGSLRSKLEKTKRRRNGSNATGTTIGAMIGASHNTLMSPAANSSVPKLTGFAVASKKRNRDFHQLFRSVPEDDYLIEDYSCALQRDIILAGRIYVSEGHICFSSNILGWITTLVISFDEVVSVEKETTAMLFPNAIAIQTLHARHTFRSLLSREATYDLLIGIWKISHPSLQSSENGVKLVNGGTGTKTEKVDPGASDDGSEGSEDDDDVYDEDEDDDEEGGSFVEDANGSLTSSEPPEPQNQKSVARKASAVGVAVGQAAGSVPTPSDLKSAEKVGAVAAATTEFPGPPTHVPTECTDTAQHYEKILKDEIIAAPLGKIYSMLFGPTSGGFVSRFLLDEVKATELQLEDDKKGLSDENKSRTYSYIKPLSGPVGPKQTKCITTEVIDYMDLERSVSVTVTTQTPDVPSGSVFSTKTKYCIMWGPNNGTRLIMCCMIEWTGKSWLKGPIESGANAGQTTYANDLVKALRAGLSSRPRASTSGSRVKKGRKRKGDIDEGKAIAALRSSDATAKLSDWGPFEAIHGILAPVADIMQPLLTAQSLVCLLLFLLIISWFRNSRLRAPPSEMGSYPAGLTPQRMAAYDEIWRVEESALWDWLDERVGISGGNGFAYPAGSKVGNADKSHRGKDEKRRILKGNGVKRKMAEIKGMGEREVEWAIGVTEEKLSVLKNVVEHGREVVGGKGNVEPVGSADDALEREENLMRASPNEL